MSKMLKIVPLEERIVLDATAAVIYVDITAAAGGDGSSWAQAYNNLDSALTAAATSVGADQIWIADGTYTPSQIYSPNGITGGASGLNDSHLKTFNLPDDVTLYGGFQGNETSLNERNPDVYLTILSGDLLGNDINNRSDPGYLASKMDNAWHVVTAGNDISNTGVDATLDGVTIMNGFAAGPNSVVAGALVFSHESGAGAYVRFGSHLVVNDVTFLNNTAGMGPLPRNTAFGGGGIFADGAGTLLTINDSLFKHNATGIENIQAPHGSLEGGGLLINRSASADITNSEFLENAATDRGGAISAVTGLAGHLNVIDSVINNNELFGGNRGGITHFSVGAGIRAASTPLFISGTLFIDNHGVRDPNGTGGTIGGGLMIEPAAFSATPTVVENSTFIGNEAFLGGGVFMNGAGTLITMTNNVFIGNEAVSGGAIFKEGLRLNISDSLFLHNTAEASGGAIVNDYTVFDVLVPNQGPAQTLNITNSDFIGNTANGLAPTEVETFSRLYVKSLTGIDVTFRFTAGGGVLWNSGDANTVIVNSDFINNQSKDSSGGVILNGGAKYSRDLTPTVERGTGGTVSIDNSTFVNNRSDQNGAVIASQLHASVITPANLPRVTLTNSSLQNNDATNSGAVYLDDSIATITGNNFYKSNDALVADQIYGKDSVINGLPTASAAAVIANLKATNVFQNVNDLDDFLFA